MYSFLSYIPVIGSCNWFICAEKLILVYGYISLYRLTGLPLVDSWCIPFFLSVIGSCNWFVTGLSLVGSWYIYHREN